MSGIEPELGGAAQSLEEVARFRDRHAAAKGLPPIKCLSRRTRQDGRNDHV